jgi:hypothetical protein
MHPDTEPPALFEPPEPARNSAGYGLSAIEKSVFDSIEAIRAEKGIGASKAFLAQTAMELARNIHRGNMKGRAVAHESAQLVATLELLDPPAEDAGAVENLPADLRDFLNAFSAAPIKPGISSPNGVSLPRPSAAPAGHA